jgi:thiamine biosynthesis lipoprotein
MGTFLAISVYDSSRSQAWIHDVVDSAFAEVRRIEMFASNYIDTTEVGRINAAAGRDTVHVSAELIWLLRESLRYGRLSQGKFDITIGPLVRLWGFTAQEGRIPDTASLGQARRLVGQERIVLGESSVYLPVPGMEIDLGGIGKGYAVDRAATILRRNGLRNFVVDLGGNVLISWEGAAPCPPIQIRHPRDDRAPLGAIRGMSGGIATSGDYERFFLREGIRYHHILDPATGLPGRGLAGVTVLAPDAMTADALSTIVFLLGPSRGLEIARDIPGVECLVVVENQGRIEVVLTPGLRERFSPTP